MASTDRRTSVEFDWNGHSPVPGVVLDTNVVMDWLVFRNPGSTAWIAAIEHRSVRWLASDAMRDELAHVLARGIGIAKQADLGAVWTAWAVHCTITPPPSLTGAATRIRCADPDDQKFVDLALGCGTRWLVSRDRAVLRLAKRTRALGLDILTPEQWIEELGRPT